MELLPGVAHLREIPGILKIPGILNKGKVPGIDNMSELLHKCMTKAVIGDGDQIRSGPKWIFSRRGMLKVYDDHLECGDWRIDYAEIREAVLSSFRSHILRIPGYVLAVRTDAAIYHFGLNGWGYWKNELPFPVRREKTRLRISPISLIARLILIGYLVYLAWQWIARN